MEEGGELVERGTFRVDRERAIEKLARFRLADKRDFVCALVRVASLSAASAADFDVEPGSVTVRWDGRALPKELLADPLAGLLGTLEGPVAAHAGAAFLGALQAGAVEVTAAVGEPGRAEGRVWRRSGADGPADPPAGLVGTFWQARWRGGVPLGLVDRLRLSCSGAPLRLTAEGDVVEPPPTAVSVPAGEGVLRVWPAPADASFVRVRPYVAGAGAEPVTLQADLPPLAGSLIVPGLCLDASLGKAVQDSVFMAAVEAAARALEGVERLFADAHRADRERASSALRDRALAACWGAEDPAARSGNPLAAAVFRIRPKHGLAMRRWAAHAGRRVRWLQLAAADRPALADGPIFPAWDGSLYSASDLMRVFGAVRVVRASTADPGRPFMGEGLRGTTLRLFRPGDFERLQAARPGGLTFVDVSPRD